METLPEGLRNDLEVFILTRPYTVEVTTVPARKTFNAKCFWYSRTNSTIIQISKNRTGIGFFTTMCHELAHAETFHEFGIEQKIKAHGPEWKSKFREILLGFLGKGYYNKEIEDALTVSMKNPLHHSGEHPLLKKALNPGKVLVADVPYGGKFTINGIIYIKISQRYSTTTLMDQDGKTFTINKNVLVQETF